MFKHLEELVKMPGISGYEDKIKETIRNKVKEHLHLEEDNIGNLIGKRNDDGSNVVLIAHMDECGLVVSHIEDNGLIRIKKVGSIDDRLLVGREFETQTSQGTINGVIGLKAPHLVIDPEEIKKVLTWDKLYLDVGARNKKEVEKLGLSLLAPINFKKELIALSNGFVCGRSLDDRFGCLVLIELVKKLAHKKLDVNLTFVWSVQEEIGLRGAQVIANRLQPNIVIAVDSYTTTDTPDASAPFVPVKLGSGPVLRMIDNKAIASPKLKKIFVDTAKKCKIPLQIGITGGSTDGAVVQECGALMMPVGVPMRYTHSPVECIHLDDMKNLMLLLENVILGLN